MNFQSGQFWAKYQGYGVRFWPQMAHFHHCSIWNKHEGTSILTNFGYNTKAIELLFTPSWFVSITVQSSIKLKELQFLSILGKIPRL